MRNEFFEISRVLADSRPAGTLLQGAGCGGTEMVFPWPPRPLMAPISSSICVHPRPSAVKSIFTGLLGSRRIHYSISKSASICVHPWFLLMNECEPRMNTDQHGSEKSHSAARVPKWVQPPGRGDRTGTPCSKTRRSHNYPTEASESVSFLCKRVSVYALIGVRWEISPFMAGSGTSWPVLGLTKAFGLLNFR